MERTEFRAGCCNSRFVLLPSTHISVYVNVPYLLQQRRYNCTGSTIEIDGGDPTQGRRHRVDLNYRGPSHIRTLRQLCSGVDEARCANAEKEIAGLSGGLCQRKGLFGKRLAKPHHIRPQTTSAVLAAWRCFRIGGPFHRDTLTGKALGTPDIAMQLQHLLTPRCLMQTIHVLRDNRKLRYAVLQSRNTDMCRIRSRLGH